MMMTGPENYEEADRLLKRVATESLDDGSAFELIGRAIGHSLQGLAAATALSHDRMMPDESGEGWRRVADRPTRSGR